MPDYFSAEKRSKIMSSIRSVDTIPERKVRSFLHSKGLRFRLHVKKLPGNPDIVLPKYRAIVFVNGCFWHQHKKSICPLSKIPESNQAYWIPKLNRTVQRDQENIEKLIKLGWKVLVVWECEINSDSLEELSLLIRKNLL